MLFGLIFAGAGGLFTWFIVSESFRQATTYTWDKTPCLIESVEIQVDEHRDSPFQLVATYTYEAGGTRRTSTQYSLGETWDDEYESLALQRAALLGSDSNHCWVDPDNPEVAVLDRKSLWFGLLVFFPLIFVAVGLAIIYGAISGLRSRGKPGALSKLKPLSTKGGKRAGGCFLIAFGGVFFLAGTGFFTGFFVVPAYHYFASKNWIETDCEVLWSHVRSHRSDDDDGTTYQADIFYQYEWNGQQHFSNRYGPLSGVSSSGHAAKQELVNRYSKGSRHKCFVNPDTPEQALLDRSFGAAWFGLIPLVFVVVGLGIMIAGIRTSRKSSAEPSSGRTRLSLARTERDASIARPAAKRFADGSRELSPGKGRWAAVIFGAIFGLIWNGIVSVFVVSTINEWSRGASPWFQTLFMIPFVLVGLGAIVFTGYSLLQTFNPTVVILLPSESIRLGTPHRCQFRTRGSCRRIRQLQIFVKGEEKATYRRGTNTRTDSETFFRRQLFESTHPLEMATGSIEIELPGNLMFSFESGNNEIVWQIEVVGDIPNWPDMRDTYPIDVLPPEL